VAVLPDHHHLLVIGERNDVDPVPCFDDVEVMSNPRSGRDRFICPYGEDTEGLSML